MGSHDDRCRRRRGCVRRGRRVRAQSPIGSRSVAGAITWAVRPRPTPRSTRRRPVRPPAATPDERFAAEALANPAGASVIAWRQRARGGPKHLRRRLERSTVSRSGFGRAAAFRGMQLGVRVGRSPVFRNLDVSWPRVGDRRRLLLRDRYRHQQQARQDSPTVTIQHSRVLVPASCRDNRRRGSVGDLRTSSSACIICAIGCRPD
jgi:hypothetical protein